MTKLQWVVGGMFAAVCVLLINVLTLQVLGLLEPRRETLFVNTDMVVKVFVEEATIGMDVEEIGKAMPLVNEIMLAEADAIYRETGNVLINAKVVIAGGHDVSEEFAQRVIQRWNALK